MIKGTVSLENIQWRKVIITTLNICILLVFVIFLMICIKYQIRSRDKMISIEEYELVMQMIKNMGLLTFIPFVVINCVYVMYSFLNRRKVMLDNEIRLMLKSHKALYEVGDRLITPTIKLPIKVNSKKIIRSAYVTYSYDELDDKLVLLFSYRKGINCQIFTGGSKKDIVDYLLDYYEECQMTHKRGVGTKLEILNYNANEQFLNKRHMSYREAI